MWRLLIRHPLIQAGDTEDAVTEDADMDADTDASLDAEACQ